MATHSSDIHKLGLAAQHTATGLTIRQTGSCDTSYGLLSPCSASYVLTVPTDTTLIADTSDVTLSVTGVHGNHQLSVNDGTLTVTNIVAQHLSLHANDGTLIAQNVRANVVDARDNDGTMRLQLLGSPAQVTARGNDGDITITLEKNATAYRTTVTANDGTARQAIKTDPDAADHVVTATVNDGNVTVSY